MSTLSFTVLKRQMNQWNDDNERTCNARRIPVFADATEINSVLEKVYDCKHDKIL